MVHFNIHFYPLIQDDVVTDINLPLQKAIVTSGPRLPAGRDVLIVFQSPPMRGDVPMLLSAHDSNKIAFKVYANEWDRFEQALSYRNVVCIRSHSCPCARFDATQSIKQQGEKISLSNSQLTLDFDSRGKPFSVSQLGSSRHDADSLIGKVETGLCIHISSPSCKIWTSR